MNILAVDGVPVREAEKEKPVSTAAKVSALQAAGEDFEFYPTTDEILAAFADDLYEQAKTIADNDSSMGFRHRNEYFSEEKDEADTVSIGSILDVGAGDGRVFNAVKDKGPGLRFRVDYKYGIEIAYTQSDDLIRKGVFIIGRDFFQTTLIDKRYSVIFSNPPYSVYREWVLRLLRESAFGLLYLVLPVRWENSKEIKGELKRLDYKTIGEYDFTHGDRAARARVNLVRVSNKAKEYEDHHGYKRKAYTKYDPFERWIEEHIGGFDGLSEEKVTDYEEEKRFLILKRDSTVEQLVDDYAAEMNGLLEGFKAIARLPGHVLASLKLDRNSMIQTIKDNIAALKTRYWRLAFEKINAITERLTYDTRRELLESMEKFRTLDFNAGNIRSIVIWIIEHYNEYTKEQTVDIFYKLTGPDYMKAYKSNTHWDKDTWRYTGYEGKYPKGKPERYILDYRFVAKALTYHYGNRYIHANKKESVVDDLIVVLRSLGADISSLEGVNAAITQTLQSVNFYNHAKQKTETALECRFYMNGNVHLKVNQALMTKFNVEVARILGWVRGPADIAEEFEMGEKEAADLWDNPALKMIGGGDLLMLDCGEAV